MKAILILIVIVLGMMLVGWMTVRSTDNRLDIQIDTGKIEEKTEETLEKGKRLLNESGEKLDRAVEHEDEEDEHDAGKPEPVAP